MTDEIDTEEILNEMFARVREIKALGGVALMDVVDHMASVPEGWVLDPMTSYYVPKWWLQMPHDSKAN